MVSVVAGIPVWQEEPHVVAGALASCRELAAAFRYADAAGIGEPDSTWNRQADMRDHGRELARGVYGADWYVQLDADERLHNGAALVNILGAFPGFAYPIPYLHDAGGGTLAGSLLPCKVIRADTCRIVAACEYVEHAGAVYNLSGFALERPVPAGLPYIVHQPELRHAPHRRLSSLEETLTRNGVEPKPADAIRWQRPLWLVPAR
jgi:hypothetical protein